MCGIAGYIDLRRGTPDELLAATAKAMSDAIQHRGPDMGDQWTDGAEGVALAFRRLAIIDLSPLGHQPMQSANQRYVITYNGEIYNYRELRRDLEAEGASFRGQSDTEVFLEGFARWGVRETLARMVGMFAIALWDRHEKQLWLIRDRLGIKPLYYGHTSGLFLWGSELKCLRAHSGWQPKMDQEALASYLRFNYVPAPRSIYRDIHKLEPGHLLTLKPGEAPKVERYWSLDDVAAQPREQLSDTQAIEATEEILKEAVGCRMVADVPLGALLSGGIDSSTVVALMQAQSDRPVKSFSIGFDEDGYDEARHARAVAEHLGTDHTELYLSPETALDLVPQLPDWFDEPFADSSALPTYLVSQLAKEKVTVALSGDGGDEGFFGYNRHRWLAGMDRRAGALPAPVRKAAALGIGTLSPNAWDGLSRLLPEGRRPRMLGDKAHKLARALAAEDKRARYLELVSHWKDPDRLAQLGREFFTLPEGGPRDDVSAWCAWMDSRTYLHDDILTKVDRTSMAVSLEARVPLLDHRVLEHAWRMPTHMKLRDGQSKWLLRQVLYRHVPKELVERPKMGFAIPLDGWMRGPLRDWMESLLDETRLAQQGWLDPRPVRQAWKQHLDGRGNHWQALWNIAMLQAWADRWSPAA